MQPQGSEYRDAAYSRFKRAMATIEEQGGFIQVNQVDALKGWNRLMPVLVRCGGCRFTCPIQDLETLTGYVEQAGDYVRDVSLPAGRR